ncbi:adenine deaminase [bacterium]|nr:adenine deaminase [bacterium]
MNNRPSFSDAQQLLAVARGQQPAPLVLKGASVLNVFSGEFLDQDVAICGDRIAGLGHYQGHQEMNLTGRTLVPGFIDGHMHLESSMMTPRQFARAVVPRGTTTVVTDPHEIANVLGAPGIYYLLESAAGLPLDMWVMRSSCVPATHLENAGASLTAADLAQLQHPRLLGLAEMMNFPGLVHGDPECLKKVLQTGDQPVDGHAPRLTGRELCAYIAAGVQSDHECTTAEEAREKLRLGMHLMLREGSVTRDIEALLPAVDAVNAHRCFFVTDDREPIDLQREGHIDFCIRKAIRLGCPVARAYTMASYHAARYFQLHFLGALAPGYTADLVVIGDREQVSVEKVMKRGQWVGEQGRLIWTGTAPVVAAPAPTVHLPPLQVSCFEIHNPHDEVHVIELIPHQIVTGRSTARPPRINGKLSADPSQDVLKLAVVERHKATGHIGLGFVRGFGLKRGAIASTVAHDSHNLVIAGCSDEDMLQAAHEVEKLNGGWVVVADGQLLAALPLPIAGLLSDQELEKVAQANLDLIEATQKLGGTAPNPFMSLSFLALPVIPSLKLTDLGLVDVDLFSLVPLNTDALRAS